MCWRRRSHWRSAKIIFIHVPKAAGTSVAATLYGRSLGHYTAADARLFCPDLFKSLPSFAVTRNPWDRLVSAYHFVRQGGSQDAGVWRPEHYQGHAFRTFEAFVKEWLVEQDLRQADPVFQTQMHFVGDRNGQVLVDFVARTEQMEELERHLAEVLGREILIPRKNSSDRQREYRRYYSDARTRQIVGDLYGADASRLGYDF